MPTKNRLFFLGFLLFVIGCAPVPPQWPPADLRDSSCVEMYRNMDQAVARHEAQNAAGTAVPGFPYLRLNRFLADLAQRIMTPEQGGLWLHQASQWDITLRRLEWRNLPTDDPFRMRWDQEGILQDHLELCAGLLAGTDRYQPDFWKQIVERSHVPDDYNTVYRIPFYPLATLPVAVLTDRARNTFRDWFDTPWEQHPVQGALVHYQPQQRLQADPERLKAILTRASDNAFQWPLPSKDEQTYLFSVLAPELYIDEVAAYDRVITPQWNGDEIAHNPDPPKVFTYISHTWWNDRPLLQLNYVFWYPAREGDNAPWIERGPLDGMTVRLTLWPDGQVGLIDFMNSCGCYHGALTSNRLTLKPKEPGLSRGLFVPRALPKDAMTSPIKMRINSGWHQVQQVSTEEHKADTIRPYRLHSYEELEALPSPRSSRSLFRPDGVAHGSERIEYLLLFPLGVPDVGSMRQRGNHPISLIGRDHFDDPDFLQTYFESTP